MPRSRLLLTVGIALVALLPSAGSVLAECDGPFPSFRNAAPTADRIVIGRVTSGEPDPNRSDGRTSRFTIEGWSVLEGNAPVSEVVRDVDAQPCAGPIAARVGDVIAIAFGGRDFSPAVTVNAVAWISGVPPQTSGIETMSALEVYTLVGAIPPAEIIGGDAAITIDSAWVIAILMLVAVASLLVFISRGARSHPVERPS